ncbi:MAG TPA: hypothetical protein VGJ02_03445 [Pyrinomonadaceae bacterium]|jgi:hypothetical protein
MPTEQNELGRLVAVYGAAPRDLQRAAIIAVLSFLFFLAMMFAFYIRQSLLYFLLATAFLVVYLVTMFSLFSMKRAAVRMFESGIEYRKYSLSWDEISKVFTDDGIRLETKYGTTISLPSSLADHDALVRQIEFQTGLHG